MMWSWIGLLALLAAMIVIARELWPRKPKPAPPFVWPDRKTTELQSEYDDE